MAGTTLGSPGPQANTPNPGYQVGGMNFGGGIGGGQVGGIFSNLLGKAPNAAIAPVQVGLPNRADYGPTNTAPTIGDPSKGNYGLDPGQQASALKGIDNAGAAANAAEAGFTNPTGTRAFTNLMGLANEQTAAQEQAQQQSAKDAAQRRGYAGGFEDTARSASIDKMNALATAGFQGAQMIQQEEGAQYGRAIGAFTALQDSFNQAEAAGNTAYAHDLLSAHIENAGNQLKAMDLNEQEQAHYGDALNQAKQLQAQLNEQFNKDKIDNARYIQGQSAIASQLFATMATLQEKGREFNISSAQDEQKIQQQGSEFEQGLQANPNTALRALPGQQFRGMLA